LEAVKRMKNELEDCKDRLHAEELAHAEAKRRREEADKQVCAMTSH